MPPVFYGKKSEWLIRKEDQFRWLQSIAISGGILTIIVSLSVLPSSTFLSAFLVGGVVGTILALLLKLYEFVALRAGLFARGRKGEGAIFYALNKLPDNWIVFQDVQINGKGNIDYIVLCPRGIFTIEVKSHEGEITYDGRELRRNGYPLEKNFLQQARGEAWAVSDLLEKKLGEKFHFIRAVIVFSSWYARLRLPPGVINKVFVVKKKNLQKLMWWFPHTLSKDAVRDIENILKNYTANPEPRIYHW